MLEVKQVIPIDDRYFDIIIEERGEEYTSRCRLISHSVADGAPINIIEFVSDEFQHFIALGRLNVKDVAAAIERTIASRQGRVQMSHSDEMIHTVGASIVRDPEYSADLSWALIAIVYNFLNGRQNCYGYIFRSDQTWKASLPCDEGDAILDKMLELQATMERETGRKWIKALVHINRADESLDIKFEYDDPEKWVINPSDLEASVAALKP